MLKFFRFQPLSLKRYALFVLLGIFLYFNLIFILGLLGQEKLLTYSFMASPLLMVALMLLQIKRFYSITGSRFSLLAVVCFTAESTISFYSLIAFLLTFLPDRFYLNAKSVCRKCGVNLLNKIRVAYK